MPSPGTKPILKQENFSELASNEEANFAATNVSFAAFVMGEVRDMLQGIHAEIYDLRSHLEEMHVAGRHTEQRRRGSTVGVFHMDDMQAGVNDGQRDLTREQFLPMISASRAPSREPSRELKPHDAFASQPVDEPPRDTAHDEIRATEFESTGREKSHEVKKQRQESVFHRWFRSSLMRSGSVERLAMFSSSLLDRITKPQLPTRRLERFMLSSQVQGAFSVALLLYFLYTGVFWRLYEEGCFEAYHRESSADLRFYTPPEWTFTVDVAFSCLFVGEVILRLLGQECRFFFGKHWKWNTFDLCLEVLGLVHIVLEMTSSDQDVFQYLRLLKVGRVFRVANLFMHDVSWIRDLRFMTLAIVACFARLFWAAVVLVLFFFVTALVLVEGVSQYVLGVSDSTDDVEMLEKWFGSPERTMLTLFMSLTGGVDWGNMFDLLVTVSWFHGVFFVLFMACGVIAVLNIITSIFVTDAIDVAHTDLNLRMRREAETSRKMVKGLTELFMHIDGEGQGMVTSAMLQRSFRNAEVRTHFALLGLNITDAVSFFRVLDVGQGGYVEISEFVMGCLRLQGNTNLIDVEVALLDMKEMLKTALVQQRVRGT